MDKNIQEVVFNELISRYNRLFHKIILDYFNDVDDAKDIYQEFCIHLYYLIEKYYSKKPDLFDTKPWVMSIVKNFCLSEIRRRNGKRKIKYKDVENKDVFLAMFADESGLNLTFKESSDELISVMNDLMRNLEKRDVLILKMKYFYGKPSSYIRKKMNEAHVDVYIGRLKKKIKKDCGIENFNELIEKFKLSI